GLLNRRVFQARLEESIASLPVMASLTVFVIDIDGFKDINVIESHDLGDRLLQEVGRRLLNFSGSTSFVSRLGNDEFAICTLKSLTLEGACSMAKSILCLLSEPFTHIDTKPHQVTASLGIATSPSDSQEAGQLIAHAYAALEQSKTRGRNNYQFYYGEMSTALRKQRQLETLLNSALAKGQLVLYYQPRVNWRTGKIVSVEALLRWQHPERGLLLPDQFMAIAESTGLIIPIGEWVLETACKQCKTWQQSGVSIPIAVNISAQQIDQPGLDTLVHNLLKKTGLSPEYLELEVKEKLLMGNTGHRLSVLTAIRRQGVSLALDDFGTGYSSLSYLIKFPLDVLKIDLSFIQNIVSRAEAAEVASAIVALAKGLGLRLIAEGIETEAQLLAIKNYGCEEVQGHYFSPPLVAHELSKLLRTFHPWRKSIEHQTLAERR
ncbi:MAG: bifunctional diguanylate cyclase/phosphodiesterase, partial [Cyanobacteria bacterium J06598_3]